MFAAFYSDPHFYHAQIVKYCKRPFASVYDMNNELIRRYNEVVGPNDNVLWLGDCFLYASEVERRLVMERLNGRKALVIGNHDKSKHAMAQIGFDFVVDTLQMCIAGQRVLCSHYPYAGTKRRGDKVDERYIERRPQREKGQILLHGHTHSDKKFHPGDRRQIHVGVDAWDYRPATFAAVEQLIRNLTAP